MRISEKILSITAVPVPIANITAIGSEVGITPETEDSEVQPRVLNRFYAKVFLFLAMTPNISEGGVSITFSETQRSLFLRQARHYAMLSGDKNLVPGPSYGYVGENL